MDPALKCCCELIALAHGGLSSSSLESIQGLLESAVQLARADADQSVTSLSARIFEGIQHILAESPASINPTPSASPGELTTLNLGSGQYTKADEEHSELLTEAEHREVCRLLAKHSAWFNDKNPVSQRRYDEVSGRNADGHMPDLEIFKGRSLERQSVALGQKKMGVVDEVAAVLGLSFAIETNGQLKVKWGSQSELLPLSVFDGRTGDLPPADSLFNHLAFTETLGCVAALTNRGEIAVFAFDLEATSAYVERAKIEAGQERHGEMRVGGLFDDSEDDETPAETNNPEQEVLNPAQFVARQMLENRLTLSLPQVRGLAVHFDAAYALAGPRELVQVRLARMGPAIVVAKIRTFHLPDPEFSFTCVRPNLNKVVAAAFSAEKQRARVLMFGSRLQPLGSVECAAQQPITELLVSLQGGATVVLATDKDARVRLFAEHQKKIEEVVPDEPFKLGATKTAPARFGGLFDDDDDDIGGGLFG